MSLLSFDQGNSLSLSLSHSHDNLSQMYTTSQKIAFATGSEFEWRHRQYMQKMMHDVAMLSNSPIRFYTPEVSTLFVAQERRKETE